MKKHQPYNLVIIGGGPAGIAPMLAAHREGMLGELLAAGVAVIERGAHIGGGLLGSYAINSDSSGRTFADCLLGSGQEETDLTRLADHPMTRQIEAAGDGAVPLSRGWAIP